MSLVGLSTLAPDAIRTRIHDELSANFRGNYTDEEWAVWRPYLDAQDPQVLAQAVDKYVRQAGAGEWVPTLKQISAVVNSIYQAKRAADTAARSSFVCKECDGTNWNKINHNTAYPCSQCLPEAFTRWKENRYEAFGFISEDAELTGPADGVERIPPTPPKVNTGEPASAQRARQFEDFIINGNGYDTIEEYITATLEKV